MNSYEKSPSMSWISWGVWQWHKKRSEGGALKAPPPGIGLNSLRVVQVNGGPAQQSAYGIWIFWKWVGGPHTRGPALKAMTPPKWNPGCATVRVKRCSSFFFKFGPHCKNLLNKARVFLQITWKTRLRASAEIKMNRWIYLMSYSSVHYHVHRSEWISFPSNLKKNSSLFKKILTVRPHLKNEL